MKALSTFVLSALLTATGSYGQSAAPAVFNEANYTQISKGVDPDNSFNRYVIIYRNTADSGYLMKKVFVDSSYADLMSKSFVKANLAEGPFTMYAGGKVAVQATYKSGKWDGERKTFMNGVLVQKAVFTEGLKTGTWEEYSPQGQLKRKTTYDNNGTVVSDLRY